MERKPWHGWKHCHEERWHHRRHHKKWCHDGGKDWGWDPCNEWESHCEKKWAC